MELRQLKYFSVVGQTLNFSRAAEILNIAQPPLSRQIQQLEEELGVLLLERQTRPLKLTEAGAFLLDQSLKLLDKVSDITAATKRLGEERRRWLGVGFVPTTLYGFLPTLLKQFTTERGDIELTLSELTSIQQAAALKSWKIDIGFGRVPIDDDELTNVVLTEEPMVVAVPYPGPLADASSIPLTRILEETLILYPSFPRPSYADQVLKQFSVRGYNVTRFTEANALHAAIGLVAAGVGVTIVPASVQLLQRQDIVYRPITETGLVSPVIMTTRAGDASEHILLFQKFLKEMVETKERLKG